MSILLCVVPFRSVREHIDAHEWRDSIHRHNLVRHGIEGFMRIFVTYDVVAVTKLPVRLYGKRRLFQFVVRPVVDDDIGGRTGIGIDVIVHVFVRLLDKTVNSQTDEIVGDVVLFVEKRPWFASIRERQQQNPACFP